MVKNNLSLPIFLVLIVCGLSLYFVPLQSKTFYFDDNLGIAGNQAIKTLDIPRIFNSFNTRFLVGLSFALNYKFGGLHPEGYRLVNLFIHCLNAFLVYLLIRATLYFYSLRQSIPCPLEWPALFGSLLFLCHPLQTEPVNFITQRFVLMASFFYLLTMVLYIQYRKLSQKRYLFAALLSAAAAMFCKEFVVTLPVMMALYEFYFLGHSNEPTGQRCRRLVPFFLIVLIVPLVLLRTPLNASGVAAIAQPHDITRARESAGRQEYFLTELNVLRTYVRLLLVPVDQNLDYDYPLSPSLDAKTALSGSFLLGLLAMAWFTWRSYRLISFGILWFFIALSVESSVIPIGDVITEYRPYLASVGFVFTVMSVLYMRQTDVRKLNMIAAVILLGFSILTFQRNQVWKNELTLWDDTVKKSPHKARPHNNRGKIYMDEDKLSQAMFDFNEALKTDPLNQKVYNNRGITYTKEGKLDYALADLNKAIEIDPGFAEAYSNRGLAWDKKGNWAQALADYSKAIALDPRYAQAYNNRGVVYEKEGDLSQALSDYQRSLELKPDNAQAYTNIGNICTALGKFPEAIANFNKAITLDPALAKTYDDRGVLYAREGRLGRAMADFNKAIELDRGFAEAYRNRGLAYDKQGLLNQAIGDYDKAIALDLKYTRAYQDRGNVYAKQTNLNQAMLDYDRAIALDPKFAEGYQNRGLVYARQGNLSYAIADFDKAIDIDPRYVEAYSNRGLAYAKEGHFTEAVSDFNKAIELNPLFGLAYNNRAISYYQLKQYDKAWADVHKIEALGITISPVFLKELKQSSPEYLASPKPLI